MPAWVASWAICEAGSIPKTFMSASLKNFKSDPSLLPISIINELLGMPVRLSTSSAYW